MTQIILIEGISTAGKSTLQKLLTQTLEKQGKSVLKVEEKESIKNLFDEKTKNLNHSLNLLKTIIKEKTKSKKDYIIFDRFHFAHNATLKTKFEDYKEIEDLLFKYNTRVIYLHVNKNKIIKRLRDALKGDRKETTFHKKHFYNVIVPNAKNKLEEDKMIYNFYSGRIDYHLQDIKKSKLEILKINVSNKKHSDYKALIPKILN